MKHPYSSLLKYLEELDQELLQVVIHKDLLKHYRALIILEKDPVDWPIKLQPLSAYTNSKSLSFPLVITRDFILNSLDTFPLEFIEISSNEKIVLYEKEDLLSGLNFKDQDLRLQIERELRSKWLLTRQAYLELKNPQRGLKHCMHASISSLIPAFKGLFFLAKQPYPQSLEALFEHAALISKIDLQPLYYWMQDKDFELSDLTRYISILEKLTHFMEVYLE